MAKEIKHFLDLNKINYKEIRKILDLSKSYKQGITSGHDILKGKTLCLIFEKQSTRTRVAFEIAMQQLGGTVTILEEENIPPTVDVGEDLEVVRIIMKHFSNGAVFRLEDIIEYLDRNPQLPLRNRNVHRRWRKYRQSLL